MGIMFGWEPLLPVLLALDDVGLLVLVAPPAAFADPTHLKPLLRQHL